MAAILRSFGPNSIIVFKFNVGFRVTELTPEERTRKNLTYQNAVHIKERCRSVQDVSPMLITNQGFINAHYKGNDMYDVDLFGVEEAYANAGRRISTSGGSSLTKKAGAEPCRVIGADVEQACSRTLIPSAS